MDENKNTPTPKGVTYELAEDGTVYRAPAGGERTKEATVSGKVLTFLTPEAKKRTPAIIRFLRALTPPVEIEDKRDGFDAAAVPAFEPAPVIPASALSADEAPPPVAVGAAIPPRPKADKMLGDKDPAVVDWYQKYHPQEFERRYGVVGDGLHTKRVMQLVKGDRKMVEVSKPALLARRKTHLTEIPRE